MSASAKNTAGKTGLFFKLTGAAALAADKARLEAFLSAAPLAYCGWSVRDGAIAYNPAFCDLLGLPKISHIADIETALTPSDAAVLEGQFTQLQEQGAPFTIQVQNADRSKTLRISGKRGAALDGAESFDILWMEDITAAHAQRARAEEAQSNIERERDHLQAALDRYPLPLWMRNKRGEIIWCNRAYAAVVETSPATIIAEQKELPFKPARKTPVLVPGKALAQAAFEKNAAEEVAAYIVIGGKRHLMRVCESVLPQLGLTLGMVFDVTREEELEAEQKRHGAANKELLEHLGAAIAIFDSAQKLEFYNSALAQLWGLDDKYLNTGPKLGDLMEKLRESRLLPEQADFRKYKQSWLVMFTSLLAPYEDMLYLPSGQALRMLVIPHPMGGLMMTFEDVTSRLELESSYNTLVAVQKETLDNLAEGVAVFGGDGRLKLWNPSFARLWGFNPEDLEGQPHITRLSEKMGARFAPEEGPRAQKNIASQALERREQSGRMNCADGALVEYATVPLPDGGVLVTHVDITDSVRVENALREKNAALEAAERLKLDFLANVSYQLRTPLNAIMGFAEILRNEYFGTLNARQKEYTAGIGEAGKRLLSLIDDILDLSTIEAGYMQLSMEALDVPAILESIHDLTQDWARKEKVEIKLDCAQALSPVQGDERRIKQALLNLVRNAIAHTPPGGTITLGAAQAGDVMRIFVRDTGPGIATIDQARIFAPFERAGSSEKSARGAGLGLALVKNIVELHKGRITLESEEGKGSCFAVLLPAGD